MLLFTLYFVAILILSSFCNINFIRSIDSQVVKSEFTYTLDEGYPIGKSLFGNIAGVDVDRNNNVIIFHRGSHKWDESTFNAEEIYQLDRNSPISQDTVISIDPIKKKVVNAWGANWFYMPHGLSLDQEGKNVWLTDVALHQVFKYPIDGSRELLTLGTAFQPGTDENHFCKPTSVADTGEFIFVADGYCNSRIVMFSALGKYLGEFGQSSDAYLMNNANIQPTFNVPHKITYAKEASMLCVADRENGRIQCFSFEPKQNKMNQDDTGLILNGAIKLKFTLADPAFNGRLFSLDYSPIRGGIIVAVSGESLYKPRKPPLGFVYNVTTGQLLSRFSPPRDTFGMAHDLAITGKEANSIYVVDIAPVNLWKFSRPNQQGQREQSSAYYLEKSGINRAIDIVREKGNGFGYVWYILIVSIIGVIIFASLRTRRVVRHSGQPNSFASLYSNNYSTPINSLFGGNRFNRRPGATGSRQLFSTMFSRRAFFNLFNQNKRQRQDEFSRLPSEDSDNSEDDKSDSDVEEFNINQTNTSIKIDV